MIREYYFAEPRPTDAVELDPTEGSVIFPNGAQIDSYEFSGGATFRLVIDGWHFDSGAVGELINFLQAAKARLSKD